MKILGRYDSKQISTTRLYSGILNRINEIPHSFAWRYSTQAKNNVKKIEKFHNLHKGNRCFIVANGPSLLNTDLSLLQNEITFGVNRIYLNFVSSSFRPTYYVAVNKLVIRQFANEISKLEMPKFINWNERGCFEPDSKGIFYLKPRLVLNDYFEEDLTHPFVFGGTVTFVALQLAFYMGFEEVILIGLDHNYNEKGIPNTTEVRKLNKDESHFHPDYFPKGTSWQLPDLIRSEYDYELARREFEVKGRKIYDATIEGKCNIFQKQKLRSFFQ